MKVRELIRELSNVDPEDEVHIITGIGLCPLAAVFRPETGNYTLIAPRLRSRSGSRFSPEEDLVLQTLKVVGADDEQIAKALGRSLRSVKARKPKLGIRD